MAKSEDGMSYIAEAKTRGLSDETILNLLEDAGWTRRESAHALASHYAEVTGLRAPESPRRRESIGLDVFFNVVASILLISLVTALSILLHGFVDDMIPSAADAGRGYQRDESLFAIATAIIGGPLYLLVMVILNRRLAAGASLWNAPIRQWIIGLLLAAGIATIFYSAVSLLSSLLGGTEDSLRSAGKLLVTSVLVGGASWYYAHWLRGPSQNSVVDNAKN
ncbi:MAG: DUF5671 domain-containing protein [Armatimonadetes bacterium]|nr:DUF5671 domain-containing protein [Armatimonadota bacterium]